jgi:hypothetical protein
MAVGLGGRGKVPNPHMARLARAIAVHGAGSLAEGAAKAIPGAPTPAAPSGPKKPGFHPREVLKSFEPGKVHTGQELSKEARALTVLETRPLVHGYKELAKQLGEQRDQTDQGLSGLGTRTMGNVSSVYQNIAQSEAQNIAHQQALGSQLSATSAGIAQGAGTDLAAQQSGALGDYEKQLQMRGAPAGGGAQEALAQAVASQQASQSADSQAAQQFANVQGGSYGALAGAMAGSAQMQGGEAIGDIGRDVVNRVGESDLKFNQSQQTALGKLGEAKAAYGPTFAKNLQGLTGEERKFILGKNAVQGEKAKLGLEGTKLQNEAAQNAIANQINQQKANAESTSAAASAQNAATDAWKARHPAATAAEIKKTKQSAAEVKAYLPSAVATYGAPKNPKMLNQFIGAVNKEVSASPQIVQSVLKRWFAKKTRNENVKKALPSFP